MPEPGRAMGTMAQPQLPHRIQVRCDDAFRKQIEAFAKSNNMGLADAIRHLCLTQLAEREEAKFEARSNFRRAEIDEYLFIAIAQLVHERLPGKHDVIMLEAAKNIRQFHTEHPGR